MAKGNVANLRRGLPVGYRLKSDADLKGRYRKRLGMNEHRTLVEQRIGMKLPATAVVHHVNPDDKLTNQGPFVVCQDNGYHNLLERRGRALRECGHVDWRQCYRCGKWDDPRNLIVSLRRKPRRGDNVGDVVHAKLRGECVDLPAPMTAGGFVCHSSASKRHGLDARRCEANRANGATTATCAHCALPIRRIHESSVRWYASEESTQPFGREVKE